MMAAQWVVELLSPVPESGGVTSDVVPVSEPDDVLLPSAHANIISTILQTRPNQY